MPAHSYLQSVTTFSYGAEVIADGVVYTGPGDLVGIVVCSHTSGSIKLYDSLTASGSVLLPTYTYATGSQVIPMYGMTFVNGIYADISGTQDIVICYNK